MKTPINDDISVIGHDLESLSEQMRSSANEERETRKRLDNLARKLQILAEELEVDVPVPKPLGEIELETGFSDLAIAASVLPKERLHELEDRFFRSVPCVPPLDRFDVFLLMALGGMVALADFLLVGLPSPTKWVPSNEGGVVSTGWLSDRLKSWTTKNDNWLADLCKVPFDKVNVPGIETGLSSRNHRLLSFGHDPSPVGMVFGLLDIASGGMSAITRDGQIFHLSGVPAGVEKILIAPLLWIGHLATDVATPMGIPVPGWGLTQLLRLPAPGASGDPTIADVARIMYEQGYDFRHYFAGGIVPALIEIVLRTYHFVRYSYPAKHVDQSMARLTGGSAEQYVSDSCIDSHLKALLFWGHAIATAINAGKITIQGITGDYFSAVRAINIAQWQAFAVRALQYLAHRLRDNKVEQIVANRTTLNERWDNLNAFRCLGEDGAPSLVLSMEGKS